jgi:exopolysaccharide biosynthesis predicted pyruvyltransferase EpsI
LKFIDFLILNKHKKTYIDPCSGNNGDLLILEGMKEVIKISGINVVSSVSEAELIIINGGGMFIDAYTQGIGKIKEYSSRFPHVHLCVAPNSYHFTTVDFGKVLDIRESKLTLFSREKYSKAYIDDLVSKREYIDSFLDDDLAFNLKNSKLINNILEKYPNPDEGRVLVVDRMDLEHAKAKGKHSNLKKLYIMLIPETIKVMLRKIRFLFRNTVGSSFTRESLKKINIENPNFKAKIIETSDISRVDITDFDGFIEKIARAEYIFTNRLHVGVLGHLLGRNVYMVEGSYHKMTGIYEYSMVDTQTTKILRD